MMKKIFILNLLFLVVTGHLYCQETNLGIDTLAPENENNVRKTIIDSTFYYKDSSIRMRERIGYKKRIKATLLNVKDSASRSNAIVEYVFTPNGEGRQYNGRRDGIWLSKRNHLLTMLAEYKGGKKHGIYKAYYPSGEIKEFGNYFNNFKIGEWIEFYEDRRIKSVGSYYPDTICRLMLPTKEDSIARDSVKEDIKGDILVSGPYLETIYLKHGEWYYYHPTGKLYLKEFYDKGNLLRKEEH